MHRESLFYSALQRSSCEGSAYRSADDLPTLNPEQVENFKEDAEEEIQLKLDI